MHGRAVYNAESRKKKAMKTLAVLEDHLGRLNDKYVLDIGCAAGLSTTWYAQATHCVVGIDIDIPAVSYASLNNTEANLIFAVMDSERLGYGNDSFDIVICNHIYEHVPDPEMLMAEIHRVLKPGGVCFFGAGNRLSIMEPHYHLPFLSIVPKVVAHWYLRALHRGAHYYETHLTYWGLRRLVSNFIVNDYTQRIISEPDRFNAGDVIREGSWQQRLYLLLFRIAYWACPTYVWLLRKNARSRAG